MKNVVCSLFMIAFISFSSGVMAMDLPSCTVPGPNELLGSVGGTVKDPREAHILTRVNILQADLSTARKARQISASKADELWKRGEKIRHNVAGYVKDQGFLSAGERASYDRELNVMLKTLCDKR